MSQLERSQTALEAAFECNPLSPEVNSPGQDCSVLENHALGPHLDPALGGESDGQGWNKAPCSPNTLTFGTLSERGCQSDQAMRS